MDSLPRDIELKLLATRGWSIDERRMHGIPPGKLQLPDLEINPQIFHWCSPSKLATETRLVTTLPSGRVYMRVRDTFRPLNDIYEEQRVVLSQGWSQILGRNFLDGRQWSLDQKWID